jgi:transglutaminase-like putative cysteine protease
MRLRVEHETLFTYDSPITEGYTELRLRPLESGGQRCLSFAIETEPRAEVRGFTDRFGNDVRHFDVLSPHQRLRVLARSEVATADAFADDEPELRPLDRYDYLSPSRFVPFEESVREFAGALGDGGDADAVARRVVQAVRARLRYQPGATDAGTDAALALEHGRGVCQDFAHLALAAFRLNGVPARYVSGYVQAQGPEGASASHAWVDYYVEGRGFVSIDPTHDTPQTPRHLRVGVGRDYADVPPTRGVYKGDAAERLEVTVRVSG